MSIVLIFCVLAAAGWLLLVLSSRDTKDDPGGSVAAYSRAMGALDPSEQPRPSGQPPARSRRPQPGPRRRPQGGRPTSARRRAPRPAARR